MSDILWIITKPKETIKIEFTNLNFIEKFILKRTQKKITSLMNDNKLIGRSFDCIIVDEAEEGRKNGY